LLAKLFIKAFKGECSLQGFNSSIDAPMNLGEAIVKIKWSTSQAND